MGDRGNIVVDGVWLYTHWGGYDLKRILKDALIKGKDRWTDTPYLTRIIFCEMIKEDVNGMTGYGISNEMGANEHNILHVNCKDGLVSERTEDGERLHQFTFQDFINEEQGDLE